MSQVSSLGPRSIW